MLARTANDLYWIGRNIERAENMARILEVGYRLILLRQGGSHHEWGSTLRGAGCEQSFNAKYPKPETRDVIDFILLDPENPSSVFSCLRAARENARAQRTALTRQVWEVLNSAWIEFSSTASVRTSVNRLPSLFEWVKQRSALFRGSLLNTILHNDSFYFTQLGTFLERADNTARILDVKYYVLLPQAQMVGGDIDNIQWKSILRSVSAHRSYRWVYGNTITSWNIADYLILNTQMPRSLRACYNEIVSAILGLNRLYGNSCSCTQTAQQTLARLTEVDIDEIFQSGLHEFLVEFIAGNNYLGNEISEFYCFND